MNKRIPLIGLGTYVSKTRHSVTKAVDAVAVRAGYRFIDGAWGYDNEDEVGEALTRLFKEGVVKREELTIVGKLHNIHHAKEHVRPYFMESLKRLQLDYIDIYLVHWPMGEAYCQRSDMEMYKWPVPLDENGNVRRSDVHYLETWKEMEKLVDEGLVKHIGLSNFNRRQIEEILAHARIRPTFLEIEAHPLLQQHKLVDYCRQQDIDVIAYCPIARGHDAVFKNQIILDLAKKYNKNPAQICIRYLMDRGLTPIPKSTDEERIKSNFNVFDFKLSDEDLQRVATIDQGFRLCPFTEQKDHPLYPFHDEY